MSDPVPPPGPPPGPPPPGSTLYIIIATLNAGSHLLRLLDALGKESQANGLPMRVVLIDNGSTDGTRQWALDQARASNGALTVLANEINIGAGPAWNLGIKWALQNGAQLMLVAGHDVWPMPGCLRRMVQLALQGVPMVTGTAVPYFTAEAVCPELGPQDPLLAAPDYSFFLLSNATIQRLGQWDAQNAQRQPKHSPWCWGLFDERFYPAYFEDNDHHYRLQQAELLAARDPAAIFRHDVSLTLRSVPALNEVNAQTFPRNRDYFIEKWGGLPHVVAKDLPARPMNVSEEQWLAMSGGRPVTTLPAEEVVAQAQRVYGQQPRQEVKIPEIVEP